MYSSIKDLTVLGNDFFSLVIKKGVSSEKKHMNDNMQIQLCNEVPLFAKTDKEKF